ncbi:YeiH family protein [Albibacterium indicum]|uniref:YeiH family protein n=1 Tax=Albibacterium indicum TaxID=2292082 RepID=UPI000E55572D|nr:putative sulfate exporter family transporter [Pedobacter indicus]
MSNKIKAIVHEDWAVVILGLLSIAIILSGFVVPVPTFKWTSLSDIGTTILSTVNLQNIGVQYLFMLVIAILGAWLTGKRMFGFVKGFTIVYLLTLFALLITGNSVVVSLNLEAVIFSLAIGLFISNFFVLPQWFKDTLSTELFVKVGLVLLGTQVIFSNILEAGALGLIQAIAVVLSVWYFAFWLCKKMKIDSELTMMISSAVSICGVSAAIATSGAIQGDSKKLSYVISMVLITAIPMMIFMPYLAHYMGLSQEVTGAWLGGSIDTTGAVVASGSLVGEEALKISTIVKFSQNVMLGLAAFAISIYWTLTQTTNSDGSRPEKPTLGVIWERFPKFVIGFVAASLLFSFFISPETVNAVKGSIKSVQGLWFALAFTSIGLETNFNDLFKQNSKKPLYAFMIAQGFNVIVTLIIAYILFN